MTPDASSDGACEPYISWYRATHLSQTPYTQALTNAIERFRTAFQDRSEALTSPPLYPARITSPTSVRLSELNLGLHIWPSPLLLTLNHNVSSDPGQQLPPPFDPKAQPRYTKQRVQTINVWETLVIFLVANWSGYGGAQCPLHALGLEPSRECCDLIDDLHAYAVIQQRFQPRARTIQDLVYEFFVFNLRDANPTPRTNPLLWWLGVLTHCDVHHLKPLLPLPDIEDDMSLPAMVEALDHYARVVIAHETYQEWTKQPSERRNLPSWKNEVPLSLMEADLTWVGNDEDSPPLDPSRNIDLHSPAWADFHHALMTAANTWLVDTSAGPMHEVASLRNGKAPPSRLPTSLSVADAPAKTFYRVWYNAVDEWSVDPRTLSGEYPARLKECYESSEEACKAAERIFDHTLREHIEQDPSQIDVVEELEVFQEIFSIGADKDRVVHCNSVYNDDGTMRARCIYIDGDAYNVKVTAWVEKEVGSTG